MSGGYRHKATTSTLFRVEVVVNCLLFLFALGAIPIDHIAVASQSPPTQLRILSATRDLWLSKISMVPIDQPFVAVGNRIPHGTIFVSARATIAQKVALWFSNSH